ncbi:hypothetical protein CE91St58_37110 [Lachnospiraceae bacterium]|nr:hypothetical protein CE91St58_37110 [Lachnospiraceae bacterium]
MAESRQNGTFRNTPFLSLEQKTHLLPLRQGRKVPGGEDGRRQAWDRGMADCPGKESKFH